MTTPTDHHHTKEPRMNTATPTAPGAVVLLSGGLDSTVLATHLAHHHGVDNVHALTVGYGQRHDKERAAAQRVADHLMVTIRHVDLGGLAELLPSALTRPSRTVPAGAYTTGNMAETAVPNRNAVLLMVAAGYAQGLGVGTVATAVHAGDHPIYPDCTAEFIAAANVAAREGTGGRVGVTAPFVDHTKGGIVAYGHTLNAPMHLSWSCYEGGAVHCGRCGTCTERRDAFAEVGVHDPTVYLNTALPFDVETTP